MLQVEVVVRRTHSADALRQNVNAKANFNVELKSSGRQAGRQADHTVR